MGKKEIFLSFEVFEGSLRESYVDDAICDFHIDMSELHEKMDCYGSGPQLIELELAACLNYLALTFRQSAGFLEPVQCVRQRSAKARVLHLFLLWDI